MRRLLPLTVLAVLLASTATTLAASLPVNQRFVDAKGKVSLLTRAGKVGYVTGSTKCGRLADQRVSLKGGKVRSRKRARIKISGTIPTSRSVRIRVTRKQCSVSLTLRRNTKPE